MELVEPGGNTQALELFRLEDGLKLIAHRHLDGRGAAFKLFRREDGLKRNPAARVGRAGLLFLSYFDVKTD